MPDDWTLEHFNVERDRRAVLPMIGAAQAAARGEGITFFVTPWSPPPRMKTNGQMNRGGTLRPECRQVWADQTGRPNHIGNFFSAPILDDTQADAPYFQSSY